MEVARPRRADKSPGEPCRCRGDMRRSEKSEEIRYRSPLTPYSSGDRSYSAATFGAYWKRSFAAKVLNDEAFCIRRANWELSGDNGAQFSQPGGAQVPWVISSYQSRRYGLSEEEKAPSRKLAPSRSYAGITRIRFKGPAHRHLSIVRCSPRNDLKHAKTSWACQQAIVALCA